MNSEIQNHNIKAITTVAKPENPHEKQNEGGLLTINGTLVVIMVSFIIFTVLMQKVLYGPLTKIRLKRFEHIKKMKTEADNAFLETEKLNKDYQENLKDARKKVSEKTTDLLNEANEEKNKIIEEKKQEISEYLSEQKQIIQNEKSQALDALKVQVMDYAYNISRNILGEDVSMAGLSPEIIDKALNR